MASARLTRIRNAAPKSTVLSTLAQRRPPQDSQQCSIQQVSAEVEADLAALVEQLGGRPGLVDQAMSQFIGAVVGRARAGGSNGTINIMVRFPLLVHAAEAGDPAAGKSAALVHLLWWTAARFLDDLADTSTSTGPETRQDAAAGNRGVLAAIAAGCHLPTRLFATAEVDDATRVHLMHEVSRCWLDGISGQLLDYAARPADTTTDAVLDSYRGKTGAPYAMASALAARLAGADDHRTDRWREIGRQLGVLRQLVNDRKDLVTGRDEDLRNGTATYLLAYLVQSLAEPLRAQMLALHAAAATSPQARSALRHHLLAPEVVDGYCRQVDAMVDDVHRALDGLGGEPPYAAHLHALVDESMDMFHLPGTPAASPATAGSGATRG